MVCDQAQQYGVSAVRSDDNHESDGGKPQDFLTVNLALWQKVIGSDANEKSDMEDAQHHDNVNFSMPWTRSGQTSQAQPCATANKPVP